MGQARSEQTYALEHHGVLDKGEYGHLKDFERRRWLGTRVS